jgi:hypothetical protein
MPENLGMILGKVQQERSGYPTENLGIELGLVLGSLFRVP